MLSPKIISLTLSLALLAPTAVAQIAGSAPAAAPTATLTILVLEGDRAVNNLRTGEATPPVVEVRDADTHPVEGAEVVFELPAAGPGAFFAGRARTQTVRTNQQGQATVTGYLLNGQSGRFNIRVTAKFGDAAGRAVITQTNSADTHSRATVGKSGGKKKWILVGIAAAAAAAATGAAMRDSGPTDVVLSPGAIVLGGPR